MYICIYIYIYIYTVFYVQTKKTIETTKTENRPENRPEKRKSSRRKPENLDRRNKMQDGSIRRIGNPFSAGESTGDSPSSKLPSPSAKESRSNPSDLAETLTHHSLPSWISVGLWRSLALGVSGDLWGSLGISGDHVSGGLWGSLLEPRRQIS